VIDGLSVLAVIPARGGSKGLPGKNILDLGGKPLIAWTIDAAHQSRYIDRTIVSSDDPSIIEVAHQHGCETPFVRPAHLASDTASSHAVMLHAVQSVGSYDLIVLLQPTSPLRRSLDIDNALERLVKSNVDNCISVCRASEHPHWMFTCDEKNQLKRYTQGIPAAHRRQDLPQLFIPNGAIYIIRAGRLEQSKSLILDDSVAYEMNPADSVDIDNEIDMQLAGILLAARLCKSQARPQSLNDNVAN
jgi:N-acylneuraminate cytidylyltransferase